MKKLINVLFLFGIFMATQTFADVGHFGSSTALDNTGTLKSGSIEQFFIWCKNTSGATVDAGAVVVADTSADDGYSCTTSSTAGAIPICVMAESCAASSNCKCQTYGYMADATFDDTNGAATAGQAAYISENYAGWVQANPLTSVSAFDVPIGVFYDSPSASADVELFIKLR